MKHYTFADWATQGYLSVVAGLIAFFHGDTVRAWPVLLGLHLLLAGAIHWLAVADAVQPGRRWLRFLRDFHPVLLFTFFYRETGWLNQMFATAYLDPWMIRMDQWLFGFQPGVEWMQKFPSLAVSELMYAAYFSYYLMIAGLGLALLRRNREQFRHFVGVVAFCFYCCYFTYIFVPVMGPRIFLRPPPGFVMPEDIQPWVPDPSLPAGVQSGLLFQLMAFIYETFEAPGAAFPSSHVVIAVVTAWLSRRYFPRLHPVHAGLVVLLCASTVYCRYHYVVDVIAGLVASVGLLAVSDWLYRRFDEIPAVSIIRE